ncbi:MAG: alpha/beta fold hydrolase [Solirubrobacterales bacterium]|nr:alpha/beta fold hydrolase [Solirubrobacterales bacterium]
MRPQTTVEEVRIHGHQVRYRTATSDPANPVLLLVHGIAGSSQTWEEVIPDLARDYTVIAPDLLGHGESAKPRGDYSLGAYASGLRDLLAVLGHDRATVVGHSLGGGIAMVFAYQFPERTERMVLVDSGGLGQDVSIALRAASLPGSEFVLPLLFSTPLLRAGGALAGALGKLGLRGGPDMEEIARGISSFADVQTRTAFVHTVRAVIDPAGQRVSARDRLYLADGMPTLLIWGDRDRIIPIEHGHAAAELIDGSRLEIFPGAGHFPHRDDPMRFVAVLQDFLATTEPAWIDDDVARRLLQERAAA